MSTRTSVLVVGLLVLGIAATMVAAGSIRKPDVPDRFDAQVICEKFVKDALRSPSSAVFSGPGETTATAIAPHVWMVHGWVDASNGFGAQVRNSYECQATYTGQSGTSLNWRRDVLNITPR